MTSNSPRARRREQSQIAATEVASAPLVAQVPQRVTQPEAPSPPPPEVTLKVSEIPDLRGFIIDAATGTRPHPDDVFTKLLPHGSVMVSHKRLLERQGSGLRETTKLLIPIGARLSEAQAGTIVARLRSQMPTPDATPVEGS